jgi:hypothetical protein
MELLSDDNDLTKQRSNEWFPRRNRPQEGQTNFMQEPTDEELEDFIKRTWDKTRSERFAIQLELANAKAASNGTYEIIGNSIRAFKESTGGKAAIWTTTQTKDAALSHFFPNTWIFGIAKWMRTLSTFGQQVSTSTKFQKQLIASPAYQKHPATNSAIPADTKPRKPAIVLSTTQSAPAGFSFSNPDSKYMHRS